MRTECRGRERWPKVFAGVLTLTFLVVATPCWAQTMGAPPPARSGDEAIDVALNAIQGPVLQPLLVPPGTRPGIPAFPPYKQEPPAAQRDFRTLSSPTAAPPPNPGKGAAGQPGGATGSGGAGGDGKPPGGQFKPPDIDPNLPDIGLPPPGPGLPLRRR